MLQPGIRAMPLRWESQVQDTGPQETSQLHVISNGENFSEISISTPTPSSTQWPESYSPGHHIPYTQTHPLAERLPKIIVRPQTPQTHKQTWTSATGRKDPDSSTRTQGLVSPTRKPIQHTEPILATGDRHQKQCELWTGSLRNGDPKHSKLSKMRRQRKTQQMKEKGKNPPDLTNEEEIGSLPEKEFRIIIVNMIQNLGHRI